MQENSGKNIVIFSDGTGQAGGLIPDELRSNIYKLFRATRCGPDTNIDPRKQVAFYDPGLGSSADGKSKVGLYRRLKNSLSQATGLGLADNIIDCYSALLYYYRPGDRIFLVGFSRGAYTVRCLGGVIALCGIPTTMADGKASLRRDPRTIRKIAGEAVNEIYQHGISRTREGLREMLEDQRKELAKSFRNRHKCNHGSIIERSNVAPHFIGVFDTVAALGTSRQMIAVLVALLIAMLAALGVAGGFIAHSFFAQPFWCSTIATFGALAAAGGFAALIWYLHSHLQYSHDLQGYQFRNRWHFTGWKMQFYDTQLNVNVGWARHAISIDEYRKDFARVAWGRQDVWRGVNPGEPTWLKQVWFAGNHSDVGGSYAENESRLSDIALKWMVEEAQSIPNGLLVDPAYLRLFPDAEGPQHDECKIGIPFLRYWTLKWPRAERKIDPKAELHDSVYQRLAAEEVLHYDETGRYRPNMLHEHEKAGTYFPKPD